MTLRRLSILAAGLVTLLLASCGGLTPADQDELAALGLGNGPSATGDVQIVWMGGTGAGATAAEKLAYTEIAWFDAYKKKGDRGQFRYLVTSPDGTVHREILAEVPSDHAGTGVIIDGTMAYFVGEVTYDSKAASGGHEAGGDEAGCDDTTEEGGCSGGDEGAMGSGGHEEDEGGCSGGHEGEEGPGGPKHPPGSSSRVGQIVAAVVNDAGTPGAYGDELRWAWFADPSEEHPTYLTPPSIDDIGDWPNLCEKPILGGNLVVHH